LTHVSQGGDEIQLALAQLISEKEDRLTSDESKHMTDGSFEFKPDLLNHSQTSNRHLKTPGTQEFEMKSLVQASARIELECLEES
jgi:hypothetical protein